MFAICVNTRCNLSKFIFKTNLTRNGVCACVCVCNGGKLRGRNGNRKNRAYLFSVAELGRKSKIVVFNCCEFPIRERMDGHVMAESSA